MVELVVAAVLVVVLLLVLTRLLRVGCRLVMFLFYFGILAVAAALIYSMLRRTEIMERLMR